MQTHTPAGNISLRNRNSGLPGKYSFRHPVSGYVGTYRSWMQLRNWVTEHCEGNGFPPISDEEIERQICERFSPDEMRRHCVGEGVPTSGVGLGWADILRASQTLFRFVVKGRPLVPQAEANRRAAICRVCPRNTHFSMPCASGCPELKSFVESVVGGASTPDDSFLQSCSACRCHLPSKVHLPLELLKQGDTPEIAAAYHEKCWMRPENDCVSTGNP